MAVLIDGMIGNTEHGITAIRQNIFCKQQFFREARTTGLCAKATSISASTLSKRTASITRKCVALVFNSQLLLRAEL